MKQARIFANSLGNCQARRRLATASEDNGRAKQSLRFDGQTAIVTGAGRGLGRQYALLLGSRGANVVVNDFGGTRTGLEAPGEERVAERVAGEIEALGGRASADFESVSSESGARRLVEAALSRFGRVDILINNAGILRDKSFVKMTVDDWDQVVGVHLRGSFLVSKFCWQPMREQRYGRIVMTSSTSGLYGNFGQANYAAAKMALVGLSNTLAIEGRRDGIQCNAVVPLAASRLTQDILPGELAARLRASYVAPLVAYLSHWSCQESGGVFEAAGGWFGRHRLARTAGKLLAARGDNCGPTPERIADSWIEISRLDERASQPNSFGDHLGELLRCLGEREQEEESP